MSLRQYKNDNLGRTLAVKFWSDMTEPGKTITHHNLFRADPEYSMHEKTKPDKTLAEGVIEPASTAWRRQLS